MPLNAFVVRFDGHNDRVPHEVIALERSGEIAVRVHVAMAERTAFPRAETIAWDFYYEPYGFESTPAPEWLVERIEPHLPEFLDHQARVRIDRTQASFRLLAEDIHADRNLFHRLAGYVYEKLERHSIEIVLFDEVPHYGFAYMVYLVARAMGVRTILFLQFLHTTRTLVAERIEEFGRLLARPQLSPPLTAAIEQTFTKALHVPVDRARDGVTEQLFDMHQRQIDYRTFLWLPLAWGTYVAQWMLRLVSGNRSRPRGDRLNRPLHDVFMGPEIRKLKARQTLEARARFSVSKPSLDGDFVLFALHMQPEATTHPLGGVYGDQLRAIERLREMLPTRWRILVKEHHAGFGGLRDPHFYMRLAAIGGVELIGGERPIHPLLERCRFAATITGTIGWEAVSGGKPVLTFGQAWYNGLPGVFRFEDGPAYHEIAECVIDHDALERGFRELSTRFGGFTPAWGLEDDQMPDGFDRAANSLRFVASMRSLLADRPSESREAHETRSLIGEVS